MGNEPAAHNRRHERSLKASAIALAVACGLLVTMPGFADLDADRQLESIAAEFTSKLWPSAPPERPRLCLRLRTDGDVHLPAGRHCSMWM
ncbi:MAG TPA: hypothetical protein VK603_19965 [Candidatus Saccharimonadales bacterium]|nr:hypothetical protein [Candidatus Saccharimonadales bacterium]